MKKSIKRARVKSAALLLLSLLLLAGCGTKQESAPPQNALPAQAPVIIGGAQSETPQRVKDVDFDSLANINRDIIAWVLLPGTNIDYPVVRTDDNIFYLTHNAEGQSDPGGAIFIDMSNQPDFSSPVMVAYGHYLQKDLSQLFSQLHNYKDEAYFKENQVLYIFTPQNQLDYEIVAAFTTDDSNILYGKDYTRREDMQSFIDWINGVRSMDANIDMEGVTAEDTFLILSTCTSLESSNDRYVVIARLVQQHE